MKILTVIPTLIEEMLKVGDVMWTVQPVVSGIEAPVRLDGETLTLSINNKKRKLLVDRVLYPKIKDDTHCTGTLFFTLDTTVFTTEKLKSLPHVETIKRLLIASDKVDPSLTLFSMGGTLDDIFQPLPYSERVDGTYEALRLMNGIERRAMAEGVLFKGIKFSSPNGNNLIFCRPPVEALTTLKDITYTVGRTGIIVPIAVFEPIFFNGIMVSQTTLHNIKIVEKMKFNRGDLIRVTVRRSGQQVSEIIDVCLPPPIKEPFPLASRCPSCNTLLLKTVNGGEIRCSNAFCQGRRVKSLQHWASPPVMAITNLGERLVEQLVEKNPLFRIDHLYELKIEDFTSFKGVREKTAQKIIDRINETKNKSLIKVVTGLGIPGFGDANSRVLAWHSLSIRRLMRVHKDDLEALATLFSEPQKSSLVDFLSEDENQEMLLQLSRILEPSIPTFKTIKHRYYQKTIVIDGHFPGIGVANVKTLLRRLGAKVAKSNQDKYDFYLAGVDTEMHIDFIGGNKTIKLSKVLADTLTG